MKKLSLSKVLLIILAILIVLSFLLFTIYTPKRSKPLTNIISSTANSAPSFRKDGRLSIFITKDTSQINLDIEVADEQGERMRGLMDRITLPDTAGMLFIFPEEESRSFWMKNTFISLDIIYINTEKEIVSIQKYTQPKSTYSIPSEKPARFVLEVNAGFTDRFGIMPGDKIEYSY